MTYHYDWRWQLEAKPEALWPFISNTNHFNRAAGVPHVERLDAPLANGRQRLRLKRFGVTVEWEEEPFEWEQPHRFSVRRVYARGPVAEMRVQVDLLPAAGGSEVRYQVWAEPRNLVGRVAIPLQIGEISRKRFREVFEQYAAQTKLQPPMLREATLLDIELGESAAKLSDAAEARIEAIQARLEREGYAAPLIARLVDFVKRADDAALARIRPYLLADAWGVPRKQMVELALSATRAGLLDLQWDLLCPGCRGAKESVETLGDLPETVHCTACNVDFSANFEQAVELTFTPTASIRRIEVYPFCIGGPQVTPHIVAQQLLAPGATREIRPALSPGRYRLRASQMPGAQLINVEADGDRTHAITLAGQGWPPSQPVLGPQATLLVDNQSGREQLVLIERTAWTDHALTAAEVTVLQKFRDLFSTEALRPGQTISVGNLAVLFTDLRDSTKLYRSIGDATAFGRVMDHFDVLRDALEPEEGALVKTIGDAVMAVFRKPAGAIRAILRAQESLAHGPEGVQPPFLKAGAHFGPCIGVNLNDRLDYFGSTVNIAARIGGQSRGGEIVVSDLVRMDPEVDALIEQGLVRAERFEVQLKGFEDMPFALWRISAANRRFGQC